MTRFSVALGAISSSTEHVATPLATVDFEKLEWLFSSAETNAVKKETRTDVRNIVFAPECIPWKTIGYRDSQDPQLRENRFNDTH